MKALKIVVIAVLLLGAAAASARTMGVSAGHDLDALWAQAQKTHDTAQEDAIILLDSRTVTVGDEGTVVTRVHQVVWIATAQGIRGYADLRVPWNSATSTLEVEKLRTWMDGRWWPDAEEISETAVVETLPYAVALADDYTSLRETMLLHDGVELPCIMETAYTIAVQGPPTAGADDLFVFPQRDPVVRSEYVVEVPVGVEVRWEALNGAPEPVVTENGVKELAWTMDGAGALKLPVTEQPEAYEPAIVWTTWESWEVLLREFNAAIEAAAVLDTALVDSLAATTAGLVDKFSRSQAVVEFVNASVRAVHCDPKSWLFSPRSATRTWETGYGHALDRAVLAWALLGACIDGLSVCPVDLVRAGFGGVAPELPRISDTSGLRVSLQAQGGIADYDPLTGSLVPRTRGEGLMYLGGAVPMTTTAPVLRVAMAIEPAANGWTGTAFIRAVGGSSNWVDLQIGEGSWSEFCEGQLAGLLPGICETSAKPTVASGPYLEARCAFRIGGFEADDTGRFVIAVGQPDSGVLSRLPHDVSVADERRESPVRLPWGMSQVIELRLRTAGVSAAAIPQAKTIKNGAGMFSVAVDEADGWLTVVRSIALTPEGAGLLGEDPPMIEHEPESWPDLRALLLEEMDPANGTIVLKEAE
ncbi:MAG: DUF3857 domain-containing protein [Krumholzibacteria bacterium]|nr:DUF3857 domain-containing protein [Candidatus Krumholzibacteria bacterium]